jgi:Pyruvate/2-oxoacid:ferredoxin oxidoreductase delta subunit
MSTVMRKVIKIDEERCNGCGLCVPNCAEGALQTVDGKARLVSDKYCDGLGACLGECPQGAISYEEREAEQYDHNAVVQRLQSQGREYVPHDHSVGAHTEHAHEAQGHGHGHGGFSCPSARIMDFRRDESEAEAESAEGARQRSELRQWPVKLNLVSPQAPYFQDADLLLAADCAGFAYANLHPDFMRGKALLIGCPKFDDLQYYQQKLTAILQFNNIKSITVMHMEVPCCTALNHLAETAAESAGKAVPIEEVVVSLQGEIKRRVAIAS